MKDDNGYIVVETIGTFVPFILLVISILSLVNIVAVQARIHYALTQTANTISMYSYVLELTGLANDLTNISDKAERTADSVNKFKSSIDSVFTGFEAFSDIEGTVERGEAAINEITGIVEDPKAALQGIMNYGLGELRDKAFEQLARPLVGRYLSNGDKTGDEYLRQAGVVKTSKSGIKGSEVTGLGALEFYQIGNLGSGNSVLIDSKGNIKLVVEYEIMYTFGGLKLPFKPTLRITQTVITKAWLNGSGKGYE